MKIITVGGHLSPALAVIEALPKDTDILFIGRRHALEGDKAHSLEYQQITALKIPFVDLATGRFQRKFTKHTLPSIFKLPQGFFQAIKILHDFKPDAVVCFGGYVQIPVAFAAFLLGVPLITHEQTRKAGLANRIIAPFVKFVCISWEESAKYFSAGKTISTGIPLRRKFFASVIARRYDEAIPSITRLPRSLSVARNDKSDKIIYITGGSLGAHAINQLVEGCIEKLLTRFNLIHQTGDAKEYRDFERLEEIKRGLHKNLQERYKLIKFIDPQDVAVVMTAADVVISRSGANTVAELAFLGKPCILIPLPHGQANEQLENALYAQKLGLAKVLRQEELTPDILYSQIVEFVAKLDSVKGQSSAARKFIQYDAAEKIVKIISSFASKNNYQKTES